MFFAITPVPQKNFSHFYHLGPHVVSTDAGWQRHDTDNYSCVYKGYADSGRLVDLLDQIVEEPAPALLGAFCVIVYSNHLKQLQIKTDRLRGFPLYYEGATVTNLTPLTKTVWADSIVTVDNDFAITETNFDIIGKINDTPVGLDEALEFIDQRLSKKAENLVKFTSAPIKVFLSGGVDTALVYSYLQKFTKDYELLKCNITEYDRFWLQNFAEITGHYWGYNQIHQWTTPSILTSGAPGDEFMLRSPMYADQFLKYHGIQIIDLLKERTWLHTSYFNKPKHYELFETQTVDCRMTSRQLQRNLLNKSVNDWQHWHIGNTLTWTPLRDLEIYKMFLRLPPEIAVTQIMDSAISINLIERNYPGLSRIISDQKNTGNYQKNLADFLFGSQ